MPLIVGVTGGIGCGKSTVAQLFRHLDVDTLDADDLVRELSAPTGKAYPEIISLFGADIVLPDQTLDRVQIRQRIFSDPRLREAMENILHPMVADEVLRRISQWQSVYGLLIVPLLLEKKRLLRYINRILVIDCDEAQQIKRVMISRALSEKEVKAIMATQCTRQERLAVADDIIDNNGNFSQLQSQVLRLDQLYRSLATSSTTDCRHQENT
jgi:dephospho-CoA kinase